MLNMVSHNMLEMFRALLTAVGLGAEATDKSKLRRGLGKVRFLSEIKTLNCKMKKNLFNETQKYSNH